MGLTVAACAAAVAAMVLGAPFTFGLSLLGIPPEIAACAAAGILVSAVGFATIATSPGQTNPVIHTPSIYPSSDFPQHLAEFELIPYQKPPPPKASPTTGVPTTIGKRSSYGQWPILDFGTVPQTPCECVVTYTCKYGMGWDEVRDHSYII